MTSFYVTTPIYYVNGAPHIGHAYTTIIGDVIAGYHRQRGEQVFYMTGTDEHGLKVQREAEKLGKTPLELADENSAKFRTLFDKFQIKYDRFIRTTEADHRAVVEQVYQRMFERGDIYLDKYEGWYAAADEAFVDEADTEVVDGQRRAKESKAAVEWMAEESYFFRLSKYQEPLLAWYRANPTCIAPQARYNEVVAFVEGGLQDLSISRTTFDWGIPVPGDSKHVLYVWLDALTNYITGAGAFSDPQRWEELWPCDVHLIGKDILRFHAVYWPAFLMSAGLEPARQVFAHGWWLSEGEKMSKRAGNVLDPHELAEQYDLDVLRYYMLREVPFGQDGNFVRARLAERNNAELADNLGNLVNRTLKMLERYTGGVLPETQPAAADMQLIVHALNARVAYHAHMEALELHKALEAALGLSSALNLYVHQSEPWRLAKDEATHAELHHVLVQAIEGIRWVATMLLPFMPGKMGALLDALGCTDEATRSFDAIKAWGEQLKPGLKIVAPEVLFAKMETDPGILYEQSIRKNLTSQEFKEKNPHINTDLNRIPFHLTTQFFHKILEQGKEYVVLEPSFQTDKTKHQPDMLLLTFENDKPSIYIYEITASSDDKVFAAQKIRAQKAAIELSKWLMRSDEMLGNTILIEEKNSTCVPKSVFDFSAPHIKDLLSKGQLNLKIIAALEAYDIQHNPKKKEKDVTTETTNTTNNAAPAAAESSLIEFDDFAKVELRVGLIQAAERVEKSDKLLRLTVDLGEPEARTIMAGIGKTYGPDELVGRRVAVVANLKPRKVFGTLSQGMLVAADTADGKVELTSFGESVVPGTRLG